MLTIMVGAVEAYDEELQEFTYTGGIPLKLEHSLVSLSKWESLYEKPFLGVDKKTSEETIGYIKAMALDEKIPPEIFTKLTNGNITEINKYIDAKMSATWFKDPPGPVSRNREVITAEIIYYWLIALTIPFETQHWHLNRLLTLVKVCNQKNQPEKKMSKSALAARNRQLNAERKAKLNTAG